MICILHFEPFCSPIKLSGRSALWSPASPAGVAGALHDLVSRSFVRYVTELAALTADQQIKRDMQHMYGNPANTHS